MLLKLNWLRPFIRFFATWLILFSFSWTSSDAFRSEVTHYLGITTDFDFHSANILFAYIVPAITIFMGLLSLVMDNHDVSLLFVKKTEGKHIKKPGIRTAYVNAPRILN